MSRHIRAFELSDWLVIYIVWYAAPSLTREGETKPLLSRKPFESIQLGICHNISKGELAGHMVRKKVQFARRLRKRQTPTETIMWGLLRSKRLDGYKFYRQFPIGPYIADFCCRSKRLVVEIDGGGHARPDQAVKDRARDFFLEKEGYRVIRIWSNEVMKNIEGVTDAILRRLTV